MKLKVDKIKVYRSAKTSPENQKLKVNQYQSVNSNDNGKNKVKKDIQMRPQDKWNMEPPKEVGVQTKHTNNKIPLVPPSLHMEFLQARRL